MNKHLKSLIISAVMLALALTLPFLTGQIPEIGKALSPMHIPVLLCGFICGAPWGALVGALAPILRSLLFSAPALFPDAISMLFELAAYGALAGLLYRLLPKKIPYIYVALILSMLGGRVVWGIARYVIMIAGGSAFTLDIFLAGAFVRALPGIICHILLVPIIVIAVKKTEKR